MKTLKRKQKEEQSDIEKSLEKNPRQVKPENGHASLYACMLHKIPQACECDNRGLIACAMAQSINALGVMRSSCDKWKLIKVRKGIQ